MNYAGNISITQAFWGNKTLTPYNAFVGEYPLLDPVLVPFEIEAIPISGRSNIADFWLYHIPQGAIIEYSYDNEIWATLTQGLDIVLDATGVQYPKSVFLRGNLYNQGTNYDNIGFNAGSVNNGALKVKGNIMYLFDYNNPSRSFVVGKPTGFENMFMECPNLVDASELQLPAKSLNSGPNPYNIGWTYNAMFYNCPDLVYAPASLDATVIENGAYNAMFYMCENLITVPRIEATTVYDDGGVGCFENMFYCCSKITSSPEIKLDVLPSRACYNMFYLCDNLSTITMLASDISATNCLYRWVEGVASTGTFYKHPSINIPSGISGIPNGWTVIDKLP